MRASRTGTAIGTHALARSLICAPIPPQLNSQPARIPPDLSARPCAVFAVSCACCDTDAVANAALAPASHAPLLALGVIARALWVSILILPPFCSLPASARCNVALVI